MAYNTTMWNIIGHRQILAFFEQIRNNGHLSHAYLFTGPPQVGKRTLALAFAQATLCTTGQTDPPGSPCGTCDACLKVQNATHPDLSVIRPLENKKSLSIDSIRELLRAAALQPQEGRYSIFLLPQTESLTLEAANALLKTLEEPAPHTILLLTATDEELLPQTIISRCQVMPVGLVKTDEIESELVERRGIARERAQELSVLSAGRPGWAIAASQNEELQEQRVAWFQMMNTLCESGPTQRLKVAAKLAHDTEQLDELLSIWLLWWRDRLLSSEGYRFPDHPAGNQRNHYANQIAPVVARRTIEQIQDTRRQLEQNANPRLVLETLLLELPALKQTEQIH